MTTTTSRPASGTDPAETRPTRDEIAQWGPGPLADMGPTDSPECNPDGIVEAAWSEQHRAADTKTDQRMCVTCEQPIELAAGSPTRYVHAVDADFYRSVGDHQAQPKLAHAMDADPFAGLPDTDEQPDHVWVLVDDFGEGAPAAGPFDTYEQAAAHDPHDDRFEPKRMTRAEAEKALAARRRETEEFYTALRTAGQKQAQAKAAEPAFPPAEPEPSMSLEQFQQRVKAGDWNGKPAEKPAPVEPSGYSLAVLGAVNGLGHVYAGTVPAHVVARRRAKNRVARRSRRINRGR